VAHSKVTSSSSNSGRTKPAIGHLTIVSRDEGIEAVTSAEVKVALTEVVTTTGTAPAPQKRAPAAPIDRTTTTTGGSILPVIPPTSNKRPLNRPGKTTEPPPTATSASSVVTAVGVGVAHRRWPTSRKSLSVVRPRPASTTSSSSKAGRPIISLGPRLIPLTSVLSACSPRNLPRPRRASNWRSRSRPPAPPTPVILYGSKICQSQ
jgi:hypothetical protein